MYETAYFFFRIIKKAKIFTAVDDLLPFCEIFCGKGCLGITLQIIRCFDKLAESFCPGAQPFGEGPARTVHVIIQSAARTAGLSFIRLT